MRSSTVIIGRMPSSTSTTAASILSTFLFAVIFSSIAVNAQSQAQAAPDQPYTNDFSMYPQSAQQCLQRSANTSTCTGTTHSQINACLCPGTDISSFPVRAAICIGRSSPGDLWAVYALLKADCEDSKTPLAFTRGRFMQTAFDASTSYTGGGDNSDNGSPGEYKNPTPTKGVSLSAEANGGTVGDINNSNNSNNNNNNNNNNNASGLSMMAKTGIIISCVVVGSLLGAIITYCLLLRKKNPNQSMHPSMHDPEKRPIFSSASSMKGGTNTSLSRASTVASMRDWRMMDQSTMRSPSVPAGSIRGTPYLGAPSPMTPQGQWVLDPSMGRYVLAGVPPLPTTTMVPRIPPPSVPPTPAPAPVEAPGVDVPVEMPSTPSTVTMCNWGTQSQTSTQFLHTAHQPYPIQTSLFPKNAQSSQGNGSAGASPSSLYSPKATLQPQQQPQPTAGVPKRQYSLRNMFHTRQPSKNPSYWI
ncbi:hypothetical protein MCOR27_005228 [Pyricularia oryzae]|uniref:Extracellular membrane protein CFEM domain-containing protein n=1 Tax=Pyricularia grisea TaxID=148305 RepID=A0ABQ8N3A6_PYRGI|nr:hypothetical protein MCOR27_005228 [Pyricularia oryzae]KAI6290536.1 hypothetical protein MCOR33_011239 [Pyricularia grisea]KAI6310726.1 hypothetical protein MCOR29_008525 [Pyricularia oryzae]KAI6352339.1 hypothetical protein MCOR32_011341 [Pyricularia oryzae]KAI6393493.1 hypothetical protein MCOR20_010823 [Pyricularia oryzae]